MNTKFTLTTLLFSCLFITVATAQAKREIKEEDPNKTYNLRIELSPWLGTGTMSYNPLLGWGIKGYYRLDNKFAFTAEFQRDYFDFEDNDIIDAKANDEISVDKPTNSINYELAATWYFAKKEREVEEYVGLKAMDRNTIKVDKLGVSRLALYGFRVGYSSFKGTTVNGRERHIYDASDVSKTLIEYSGNTLQSTNLVHVGLNATRIKNLKIVYPNYGTRRKQIFREYYADLLYAANVSYDGLYGALAKTYVVSNTDSHQKIGYRIGLFSTATGKIANMGYGLEMGSYPGYVESGSGFFFSLKVTFSFTAKVGIKEDE